MRHTRFVVQGSHPLLYIVRNSLIQAGYHLVDWSDDPEFCVWGGWTEPFQDIPIPVLFLSSSRVYTALDTNLEASSKGLMSENTPLLVPSSIDLRAWEQASYIKHEASMLRKAPHTMIIRPFNVYGPSITWGVVHTFLERAEHDKPIPVLGSGYEVRAFLHEEDFLNCIKKAVKRLIKHGTGIFNVGSTEEITINRLADSVLQLTGKDLPVVREYPRYRIDNWKLANTTRVRAFVRWQPTVTIRKGIWRLVQHGNETTNHMDQSASQV